MLRCPRMAWLPCVVVPLVALALSATPAHPLRADPLQARTQQADAQQADTQQADTQQAGTLQAGTLQAGFSRIDITPELHPDRPVWIAGYGTGRRATGIHDRLWARGLVLSDGRQRIGLVSVDLIGLQWADVRKIRQLVPQLDYVLVASTHNHEGPDVVGIWGPSLIRRGVDDRYLAELRERVARCLRDAAGQLAPVRAAYGTARDAALLHDSRRPEVKDDVLRVLRFEASGQDQDVRGRTAGLVVQWNCHPETLGAANTLLTADFPATTIQQLEARHGCPVVYFSGALGGLMAPPTQGFHDDQGKPLGEGQFAFAEAYGKRVAELAGQALEQSTPIRLTPLGAWPQRTMIPVTNAYYKTAGSLSVIKRQGYRWTGDFRQPGEPVELGAGEEPAAVETEVAYLRLGELHVAAIPGEIYPELVYGRFEHPVQQAVDYPDSPRERCLTQILPGSRWLLLGLANDEIGYIIPRSQWDQLPPFAYGRLRSQYGEINSCGPDVAPIIMRALESAVERAGPERPATARP